MSGESDDEIVGERSRRDAQMQTHPAGYVMVDGDCEVLNYQIGLPLSDPVHVLTWTRSGPG